MSRTCSTTIRLNKATTITDMYAALDLGQRTIRAVLKRQDGKIVNELKIKNQADAVLRFLKGTDANVVMESGYNYQCLYLVYHKTRHYDYIKELYNKFVLSYKNHF